MDPYFTSKIKLTDSPDPVALKLFQGNNKFRIIVYRGVPLSYAASKAYLTDKARKKLDKSGGGSPPLRILPRD
jgi:hypothetical protein